MIEINIDNKSYKNLQRALIDTSLFIERPISAMKKVGEAMVSSIQENFEVEGRPDKWNPLSPMTIAMRRTGEDSSKKDKILQDTGRLKGSISYALTENNSGIKVGTNVWYGEIHQFGKKIKIPKRDIFPKNKKVLRFMIGDKVIFAKKVHQKSRMVQIPQRPFLMFQDTDIEDIHNIFVEELLKQIRQS